MGNTRGKVEADGKVLPDIAIPAFGYKSHITNFPWSNPTHVGPNTSLSGFLWAAVCPVNSWKTSSIDARHGFIRRQVITNAAAHDGARLREGLIDRANTASSVWADTAYRSKANEDFLVDVGKTSQIRRRKPKGKPLPKRTARANSRRSKVRARVEHVFAHQMDRMNLAIRSSGIKRAEATIIKANIAYNLGRWRYWQGRTVSA